jgi:tetratricopeptide (TPR) repeat protein
VTLAAIVITLAIAVPAVAFALWPLVWRREGGPTLLPLPPDAREQLLERKRGALRALRELDFEHGAGHLSDTDYDELRARYESEAAAVLTELDRLGAPEPAPPPRALAPAAAGARSAWRHPLALGAAAVALLVFGIVIGVSLVRNTEPDQSAAMAPPASRPLAPIGPDGAPIVSGATGALPGAAAPRTVTPEIMQGMLGAARTSLFEGRYGEAIAAYQAVLKRDKDNVDALTHLGLIVAIGGHVDDALKTFDKALALDPNYAPALLYRGQVLLEGKKDAAGAITSWEKFVAVTPPGEDRDRVARLIDNLKMGGRDGPPKPPNARDAPAKPWRPSNSD